MYLGTFFCTLCTSTPHPDHRARPAVVAGFSPGERRWGCPPARRPAEAQQQQQQHRARSIRELLWVAPQRGEGYATSPPPPPQPASIICHSTAPHPLARAIDDGPLRLGDGTDGEGRAAGPPRGAGRRGDAGLVEEHGCCCWVVWWGRARGMGVDTNACCSVGSWGRLGRSKKGEAATRTQEKEQLDLFLSPLMGRHAKHGETLTDPVHSLRRCF